MIFLTEFLLKRKETFESIVEDPKPSNLAFLHHSITLSLIFIGNEIDLIQLEVALDDTHKTAKLFNLISQLL